MNKQVELDRELREILHQAIQSGMFQKREAFLSQIMDTLKDDYEIDKRALEKVVKVYRRMVQFDKWFPIVGFFTIPIGLIITLTVAGLIWLPLIFLAFPLFILVVLVLAFLLTFYRTYLDIQYDRYFAKVFKVKRDKK